MKKISLFVALSFVIAQLMTAQDSNNWNKRDLPAASEWVLGAGFNTINNSGSGLSEYSKFDHWAFAKIPFYGSAETNLSAKWSAKATLSLNYFKDGKQFNGATILGESEGGNDAGYLALDLGAQYYFLDSKKYEPYLLAGMGLSHFGDYSTQQNPMTLVAPEDAFTFNAGFGINYWFSVSWGINAQVLGKWVFGANNHSRASFGALYRL
jgi:hypothetical protein